MALKFSCCTSLPLHNHVKVNFKNRSNKCLDSVKNLVKSNGICSITTTPHESLTKGNWVKLICGASFEGLLSGHNIEKAWHSVQLRKAENTGLDCIDCAADASVVSAVNEGIQAAMDVVPLRRPWVMISVNDDEDLHFRKAAFDPSDCPLDCSRPCENVCPANAIKLEERESLPLQGGMINERCYGCGRCLPVCPYDKIKAVTYLRDAVATAQLIRRDDIDAIEIHTNGRQTASFNQLWDGLRDSISYLKLVAISLPNVGNPTTTLMNELFSIIKPDLSCDNLWQCDGRPMSGDIGRGATWEALAFAVRLAAAEDRPPGFIQLAGGTNGHTIKGLKEQGLHQSTRTGTLLKNGASNATIGGIAYGGYARKIVGRILRRMESQHGLACIEDHPEYLSEALQQALALVAPVKCYHHH